MIKRLGLDKYSALYLWGFFILVFGVLRPDTFLSVTSAKTILVENVLYGIMALAFLVPLTTGTYDLSIGTMMTLSIVITNVVAKNDWMPPFAGLLLGLAACAFVGFLSGFVVVKLKVNSFIATLGMSQIITAFVYFSSEQTISGVLGKSFQQLGARKVFGLPLFCYFLLIICVGLWFLLEHTPTGRHMFATGGNPEAARLAGVHTDRLVWASLVASGLLGGFAGAVYSFKVGTYGPNVGPGYLFPAIAAVFFGASQLRGRPNVWGTMIALFALATGVKGLQLTFSGSTRYIEPLFTGVSLLAAVSLASRNAVVKVPKRKRSTGQAVPPLPGVAEGVIDEPVTPTEIDAIVADGAPADTTSTT
jgi:ribose transport system permease protein